MNDETNEAQIRFENCSPDETSERAEILRQYIKESSRGVTADIVKDDQTTMDMGATLVLVLGTPAVLAVAKGISDYLKRYGGTVKISSKGDIETKGISGDDVAEIVKSLSNKK